MPKTKYPKIIRNGFAEVKVYRTKSERSPTGFIYQVAWHDGTRRQVKQIRTEGKAIEWSRHKAAAIRAGRASFDDADADTLTAVRQIIGEKSLIEALTEWQAATNEIGEEGLLVKAAAFYRRQHPEGHSETTVSDAVRLFTDAKAEMGVDVRTAYKNRLQLFTEAFPGSIITSIAVADLKDYLKRFAHPVTRNTHRKNLVTLFRWLRRNDLLPATITAAEKTDVASESESTISHFTPHQLAQALRLIYHQHPHYLPALTVAAFVGLRRAETESQVWEDIDLQAGQLTVTKAKPRTPSDRISEIPPAAVEWLMLCGNRTGRICDTDHDLDRIRKILRTAGIDTPANGFRHSAISYRMVTGHSAGHVASWAGTSEKQIHKHYRRPRTPAEGEHWFSLSPNVVLNTEKRIVR